MDDVEVTAKRRRARDLAEAYTTLFQAVDLPLQRATVFSNLDTFNEHFHTHYQANIFAPRVAKLEEIGLVKWPDGCVMHSKHHFPVIVGGFFVEEQIPYWYINDLALVETAPVDPVQIDQECLLVA